MNLPEVLDSNMKPVRILHPSQASASLSILAVPTAEVKILISEEVKLGDWVKMYYPNGKSGIFRAGNPTYDYDEGTESARLTHGCSTLADSIVTEGYKEDKDGRSEPTYFEGSLTSVIDKLLGYQKTKHWKRGTIESSDTVKVEVKYPDVLSLLNEVMEQVSGYYVEYDQSSYPWKLNVRKKPTTVTSEGRLSRNVSSAQVSYDDSELVTRLYCNALPAGHIDSKNISKYGLREDFLYASTKDTAWVEKACKVYLANRENPKVTVSIDGADFSKITGVSLDKIVLAELYRLAIPKYKVTVEEQITELSYDDIYNRPNECKITLGEHRNDLSSALAKTDQTARTASRGASAAGSQTDKAWSKFVGDVADLNTLISQTATMIRLEANDMVQKLHSELTITASQIRSEVSQVEGRFSSFIDQTAESIRMQVNDTKEQLQAAITVTSNAINLRVDDLQNDMGSAISLNREQIELRVRKGDVATSLVVELNNVSIKNGNLLVDGYIESSALYSKIAALKSVTITKLQANSIDLVDKMGRVSAVATQTNISGMMYNMTAEKNGNVVTLKYREYGSEDWGSVSFNTAARITGSWSGGVYTAAPSDTSTSTTVSTNLWNYLLNQSYDEANNVITGEVAYLVRTPLIPIDIPNSTGMVVRVNVQEAYAAGQASVGQDSTTGEWLLGVYSVKNQNQTVIRSTTLTGVSLISNSYKNADKKNEIKIKIVSEEGDTGYEPTLSIDTSNAWADGWQDYYDSNLWESISKGKLTVKRPRRAHNGLNENWFRVGIGNESWSVAPAKSANTNVLSYNLIKDNSTNVATNKINFSIDEDGEAIFVSATGQDKTRRPILMIQPKDIPLKNWSLSAANETDSPLVDKTTKTVTFNMSCTMNGKTRSSTSKKVVAVSRIPGFQDKVQVRIGSTIVAYLRLT